MKKHLLFVFFVVISSSIATHIATQCEGDKQGDVKKEVSFKRQVMSAIKDPKTLGSLVLSAFAGWAIYKLLSSNKNDAPKHERLPKIKKYSFQRKSLKPAARLKFVALGIELQYNEKTRENFGSIKAKIENYSKDNQVEGLLEAFINLHETVESSISVFENMCEIVVDDENKSREHPILKAAEAIYMDEQLLFDIETIDWSDFEEENVLILKQYFDLLLTARHSREIEFQAITRIDKACSSTKVYKKSKKRRINSKAFDPNDIH